MKKGTALETKRFKNILKSVNELKLIDPSYKIKNTNQDLLNLTFSVIQRIGRLNNNNARKISANSFIDIEKFKWNLFDQFRRHCIGIPTNQLAYEFTHHPHPEITIWEDLSLEKLKILDQSKENDVIIDVGYKDAYWTTRVRDYLHPNCIKIGIDPINNNKEEHTNHYIQSAVDNISTPKKNKFNVFNEPGCNSLLEFRDSLSSNRQDWNFREVVETQEVVTQSLENILNNLNLHDHNIYYIKCDAQGKDKDCILSARKYLKNLQYFEIEMLFSAKNSLYKKQPFALEDIIELYKHGFIPIHCSLFRPLKGSMDNLGDELIMEGEIIFANNHSK
jgi:hypothetical protein